MTYLLGLSENVTHRNRNRWIGSRALILMVNSLNLLTLRKVLRPGINDTRSQNEKAYPHRDQFVEELIQLNDAI